MHLKKILSSNLTLSLSISWHCENYWGKRTIMRKTDKGLLYDKKIYSLVLKADANDHTQFMF